ncbi:MAG: hypothetical protein P8Z00_13230 [Anaerolineales bacterium]
MKAHLSFRGLIILLFVGTMIPLLITVGLVVFRLQQTYLVNEAQNRLVSFVQAGVEQYVRDTDLTVLAVNLGEHLRVLGADMFIQDARGNPVPPSLGTGPWLDANAHQAARDAHQSSVQMIESGSSSRIVYLAALIDQNNHVLGSVEASLPMAVITDQLNALRAPDKETWRRAPRYLKFVNWGNWRQLITKCSTEYRMIFKIKPAWLKICAGLQPMLPMNCVHHFLFFAIALNCWIKPFTRMIISRLPILWPYYAKR